MLATELKVGLKLKFAEIITVKPVTEVLNLFLFYASISRDQ